MSEKFQIKLSSNEILVLAALLGYDSVFGLKEDFIFDDKADVKSLIRQNVRRLERKRLIRYDLNGILYILPMLRKAICCMCDADVVGLFSTNLKSGKKASIYVIERNDVVVSLELLNDGKYLVQTTDEIPLKEIVPYEIMTSHQCEINEKMLFEEAEYVHSQIESFNHEEAEKRIKKHVSNLEATSLIAKILTGNCGYMSVQVHRRSSVSLYSAVYNALLVAVDNSTISLIADENRILRFKATSPDEIVSQIHSQFNVNMKRGAD